MMLNIVIAKRLDVTFVSDTIYIFFKQLYVQDLIPKLIKLN